MLLSLHAGEGESEERGSELQTICRPHHGHDLHQALNAHSSLIRNGEPPLLIILGIFPASCKVFFWEMQDARAHFRTSLLEVLPDMDLCARYCVSGCLQPFWDQMSVPSADSARSVSLSGTLQSLNAGFLQAGRARHLPWAGHNPDRQEGSNKGHCACAGQVSHHHIMEGDND